MRTGCPHRCLNVLRGVAQCKQCRSMVYGAVPDSPRAGIGVVTQMREDFGDIVRVLLATVPHDQAVSESLATADGQVPPSVGFDRPAPLGPWRLARGHGCDPSGRRILVLLRLCRALYPTRRQWMVIRACRTMALSGGKSSAATRVHSQSESNAGLDREIN
jgi:hypothetical protein